MQLQPGTDLSGITDDIANWLSKSVTDKATKDAPPVLAQSFDIFVRKTPGGKQVMKKLDNFSLAATVLPLLIGAGIGFFIGHSIKR